ncbi:hypothetical protein AYO37_00845 [Opitutia bacterium SCGC AG-212-L18]|nr:hypothetical protein AYO37_00845 [Opitutae bacterium SCGC AG-212-L18]
MGKREEREQKRLTIDLRSGCDFKKSPLESGLKFVVIGYYIFLGFLLIVGVYDIAKIAIVKNGIEAIKSEEIRSLSQIRELQDLRKKTALQIEKANKLIEWQFNDIHGQRILSVLFSRLSKEVLLEKFSFKRDPKNNHQVSLSIVLKGGHRELHREFEVMLSKLEELGLMLISQNQSEFSGGMRLQLICQTNFLKKR